MNTLGGFYHPQDMADLLTMLEAELAEVLEALSAARAAQRFQIGGRSKDAADYRALADDRDRLIRQIAELGNATGSAASLAEFERPS